MKNTTANLLGFTALMMLSTTAFGQYTFGTWSTTGATTAAASLGSGTVKLSINGAGLNTSVASLKFDNATFTPTTASCANVVNPLAGNQYSYDVDFSSFGPSNGVIVGFGNFAHDNGYRGYKLEAFDASNNSIGLSTFTQIGTFDHTWLSPLPTNSFNDDVSLNTTTGIFSVTTIAGLNDINSDMFMMELPGGVNRLRISTEGPGAGDTTNVVVAVPEPASIAALGLGALGLLRRRKAAKK